VDAEACGAKWHYTKPARSYRTPPATQLGARRAAFEDSLDSRMPALGVLELPNGAVFGSYGWVYDAKGHLLPELSWYGTHGDEIRRREHTPRRPRAVEHLSGSCLTLATTWGAHFGHFVPEVLPRIGLVEAAGMRLEDFEHILLTPTPDSPTARALADRAGLSSAKVRRLEPESWIAADTMFAPSFPGRRRQYDEVVPEYLRGLAGPTSHPGSRRLFVLRRGFDRNPVEAAEMERMAQASGFELYDPMASPDQTRDFAEASAVIGVSGSALANLAFCAPGTRVVEILSDAHLHPYYYTLSGAANLRYGYVLGTSTGDAPGWGPSRADFRVDLAEFAAALDWARRPAPPAPA
jgi:capsular polysaccharide biosynthesis protein